MGRPRTPIGAFGDLSYAKTASGQIRARTRFRDDDGQIRRVSATGPTRKAAERNLKEVLSQRTSRAAYAELTPDSSFKQLVELWLEDLDLKGKLAPSTRGASLRVTSRCFMTTLHESGIEVPWGAAAGAVLADQAELPGPGGGSVRLAAPSLSRMWPTCFLTVLSVT
jgi:hypothetical protein